MMFSFYLFLTIGKWKTSTKDDWFCHLNGLLIQYSEMSAFFWLSALGHCVWKSFRRIKPPTQNLQSSIKLGIYNKKYKWYALYAWGCPSLVTILMQYLPEEMTDGYHTPGIGENSCTLHHKWGKLVYFHIVNGLILASLMINISSLS